MVEKKTALATKPENQMIDRPAYVKQGVARGTEAIESSDMIMPRLSVCQSMTPQRKKSDPNYIEGLEEGNLFNSLTGQIYGNTVDVTPLFFYKSRILFKPMDQGGGILCQAPDGKHCQLNNGGPCLHDKWGPNGEPPECTELYNFLAFITQTREMLILSFKATGVKAAKTLNSLIRMRGSDAFSGVYRLSAVPDKNNAGQEYYTYHVANVGWVDENTYKWAEEAYQNFVPKLQSQDVVMDVGGMQDDTSFNYGANAGM